MCIAAKSGIVPLGNLGPTSALLKIYGFWVEASQLKMLHVFFDGVTSRHHTVSCFSTFQPLASLSGLHLVVLSNALLGD